MDEFDNRIITALQEDGRITNVDLAKRIGLTHSACARRIQRLESAGVIRGYRAQVDRGSIGKTVRAFVGVIRSPNADWRELAERLSKIDHVIGCYVMSGEIDILLEILAKDMAEFSTAILDEVLSTPGVTASRSSFVFQEFKSTY